MNNAETGPPSNRGAHTQVIGDQPVALLRIENAGLRARVADLESRSAEPDAMRAELEEAIRRNEEIRRDRRALDREIVELRSLLAEAERQLGGIRQTFIYRIGEAIVSARGWKGLRQLPRRLIALRRAWREKRGQTAASGVLGQQKLADRLRYVDEAMTILADSGLDAAVAHVRGLPDRHAEEKSRALVELAQAVRSAEPTRAATLGLEAADLNPAEPRLRALTMALFDEGELVGPARLIEASGEALMGRPADAIRRSTILAQRRQLAEPLTFPPPGVSSAGSARRLAVVAQRSLPQHADAYTFRAQAVVDAARDRGHETFLVTAPGYQYPKSGDGGAVHRTLGSVQVVRLPQGDAPVDAYDAYVAETGAVLAAVFLRQRITHVHAIAGTSLAGAALWASRRAGARFVFDVGAAPTPGDRTDLGWETTERCRAGLSLFSDIATQADHVVVRSESLGKQLSERGLIGEHTQIDDLLPETFAPVGAERVEDIRRELGLKNQVVIGVFDSIDLDEGLADLVRALPAIRMAAPDAAILFCGSGKGAQPLLQLAARLGVADHLIIPSGFVRQRTPDYLSAFSVAVFPKHRSHTALMAPFELQAAMAVGAPIVAVDVPWSRAWIESGSNGILVTPGDVDQIANAIIRLLEDRGAAERLGAAGRSSFQARASRRVIDPMVVAMLQGGPDRSAA
ncbi:MAG: glycosyltransferase [Caulobacteraceae bacterium]